MRRTRRPLSLRARLLLGVLALLVVVFAAVGVITQAALRSYLVGRLDDQLTAANGRSMRGYDRGNPGSGPPPIGLGQGVGTLVATVQGGTPYANVLGADGAVEPVPSSAGPALIALAVDGRPRTVDLAGVGDYRLVATQTDGGELITGLPLHDVDATVTRFAVIGGLVALGALVVTGFAGATLVGLTLRPLRRVAATAGRVAELSLDRGEVALAERVQLRDADPRTEAGAVGAAMNRMLDNVDDALTARQASETRVRQFVADASHELRTPLAAIRGYAELTRRTTEPVPPDVAHALRRVESEAARMTTLVEDLLLLARLDSGRPLATDDVDLTALVLDVVSDARAAGPDHRWLLDLPADAVAVSGDQQRLHQVVANLLANARVHTPGGTTVTVGIRPYEDRVVLAVGDDGPGIPAELQPVLFERFARGDSSRSRAAGSTGLGLAIVDAVVGSHGGAVHVDSAPGRTVFSVSLPPATLTATRQDDHIATTSAQSNL